jgi:hypothetical protein
METTTPQATLGPPAWAGTGGEDVVVVVAADGSAPPPTVGEHDAAMSTAPKFQLLRAQRRSRARRICRRAGTWTSPASGLLTSTPPNIRATTVRCWRW